MRRRGRGLILDLLVETGSGPAQKAMREAPGSKEARAQPEAFSSLVQRFSFARAPDRETVDLLQSTYETAKTNGWTTAAEGAVVAPGSTVQSLTEQGNEALSSDKDALVRDQVATSLRSVDSPDARGGCWRWREARRPRPIRRW